MLIFLSFFVWFRLVISFLFPLFLTTMVLFFDVVDRQWWGGGAVSSSISGGRLIDSIRRNRFLDGAVVTAAGTTAGTGSAADGADGASLCPSVLSNRVGVDAEKNIDGHRSLQRSPVDVYRGSPSSMCA